MESTRCPLVQALGGRAEGMGASRFEAVQAAVGDVGWYQLRVILATQLGYLAIAGSMLCTVFDAPRGTPPDLNCSRPGEWDGEGVEFRSILQELGLLCDPRPLGSYTPTFLSNCVMGGGVVGACVWGYAADRWGRRWSTALPLLGVGLMNALVAGLGGLDYGLTSALFVLLGFFGGGWMVCNVICAVEAMGGQFWRLAAVSANGWPLGMMFMSLVAWSTAHWRWYHLTLAVVVLPLLAAQSMVYESPRWVLQYGRVKEAHAILSSIARINGMGEEVVEEAELALVAAEGESEARKHKHYSYVDLTRNRTVLVRLLALFYSWLASSIVSFGVYFTLGSLSGNTFVKYALLGLIKGTTGMIPLGLGRWVGRKPILLVAASCACVSSWAAVLIYLLAEEPRTSVWLTVFAVLGAAAVDPIWKVNHLYSAELFPTVVRNMARAVCNVGSRAGSVLGPQAAFLQDFYDPAPFLLFGTLSAVHVLVAALLLPETKGRPLPDKLIDLGAVSPNTGPPPASPPAYPTREETSATRRKESQF